MITYNAEGIAMPKIKKRLTSKWIKAVAASHGRKVGEVGYLFVNDDKILEVNREYLGHDYYTDPRMLRARASIVFKEEAGGLRQVVVVLLYDVVDDVLVSVLKLLG